MTHSLVGQLRFARSEWANGFRRFEPMNSIGWIVGHGTSSATG